MLFGKVKRLIDDKEKEIILNLSNNYKDSAYKAYEEYVQLINQLKDEGKVGEKDFDRFNVKIKDYKIKFKNYIK